MPSLLVPPQGLVYVDLLSGSPNLSPHPDTLWGSAVWPVDCFAAPTPSHPPPPSAFLHSLSFRTPHSHSFSANHSRPAHDMAFGSQPAMGGGASGVGYGGAIGAWGLGWEDAEDAQEGFIDPPPVFDSVAARALASHPLRPFFLAGCTNTHVYLWKVREGGRGPCVGG